MQSPKVGGRGIMPGPQVRPQVKGEPLRGRFRPPPRPEIVDGTSVIERSHQCSEDLEAKNREKIALQQLELLKKQGKWIILIIRVKKAITIF